MGIRKNAKFLTAAEREAFVKACVLMRAEIVNPAAPAAQRYSRCEQYVAIYWMVQSAFAPGAAAVNFANGGIALTVGMAVDANIIIYERIREEMAIGKSAAAALVAGYDNAFSAVIDSNLTTAIAGVVLYSYGTGPIKGFAVTLLIGIASTLFTAIFVSRTLMDLAVRRVSARALL